MVNSLGIVAFLFVISTASAFAVDWGSCQDDLDRLRRAARDAADKAEEVQSKANEVESAKSSLRWCGRDCSWERSRYESAVSNYDSAKSDLESELDTVAARIRSVESSCGYDLGSGRFTTFRGDQVDRFCAILRRLKGRMPDQTLMDTCKKSRTEEQCKQCLE